jgi:hypothetical protein
MRSDYRYRSRLGHETPTCWCPGYRDKNHTIQTRSFYRVRVSSSTLSRVHLTDTQVVSSCSVKTGNQENSVSDEYISSPVISSLRVQDSVHGARGVAMHSLGAVYSQYTVPMEGTSRCISLTEMKVCSLTYELGYTSVVRMSTFLAVTVLAGWTLRSKRT